MKNFYYFSKNKLKFIEISNFYRKFLFLIGFFSILFTFFIFGAYFFINDIVNPDVKVKELERKNRELKSLFSDLYDRYENLDNDLLELQKKNDDLRLATNLKPLSKEDREVGTGGNIFPKIDIKDMDDFNDVVSVLKKYVNNISSKLEFESNNYKEIQQKIKTNEQLFSAIPAIIPTFGSVGNDFGLRMHPILKIRRMHEGLDIVTDTGTPVYAPGGGNVSFTGNRGGYGITLEVSHGFGYKTLYGHLSRIVVRPGQKINRGDLIAYTGNSGKLTTGPHLHYEIHHNGIPLNPKNFIYDNINLFELVSK